MNSKHISEIYDDIIGQANGFIFVQQMVVWLITLAKIVVVFCDYLFIFSLFEPQCIVEKLAECVVRAN